MTLASHNFNSIRLGRVTNIDYNTNLCEVRFYDRFGGKRQDVHLSQPYVGRGWGVLCGVEIGSIALVAEETDGNIRLLAWLPHPHFFREDANTAFDDVTPDESPYRRVRTGEVVLQSKTNSIVALNEMGDIILETPDGNSIEVDREADLIFQQSAQRNIISEAGTLQAGVIRRDIRSLEERELDIIFGGSAILGLDFDTFTETVGVDPEYPDVAKVGGKGETTSDTLIPGLFDPFFPPEIESGRGSGVNISDMLNPALTEWNLTVNEFGDGNPGLDEPLFNVAPATESERKSGRLATELRNLVRLKGHIEPNVIAQVTCGTAVNDVGRQIRFDYYFGKPDADGNSKGHSRAWSTYTNQFATSWDHHFNRSNTLKAKTSSSPAGIAAPGHSIGSEWTVDTLQQSPTAILFRALLHTKGADNFGRKETELATLFRAGDERLIQEALQESFPGSLWEFVVDKEGLTKINIPAATAVGETEDGNPLEPFREGRSLLMNTDGDITMSVGKQKATGDFGLPRLTTDFFLNRNDYPDYGRKDRSLTLDLEGNFETHIGADDNVNQSFIAQMDGSMALSVGKEGDTGLSNRGATPAGVENLFDIPITPAAKAATRKDRSLTGKFAGNIELEIGADEESSQSIIISTTGGNGFRYGKDVDDQSVNLVTEGGIDIQIQGPMQTNQYALHIDAQGVVHLRATGNIMVETEGKCHVRSQGDMELESLANINMRAANSINMTAGSIANINAPTINATNGADAFTITQGNINILSTSMGLQAPAGIAVLGSLGVAGQLAAQGAPGAPPLPIARIGDLVQVGPSIGQIITGSQYSQSI